MKNTIKMPCVSKMPRPRFQVVEYSGHYSVVESSTGKEHVMSDGVGLEFPGHPEIGTEAFRLAWQAALNDCPNDTAEAYFPSR